MIGNCWVKYEGEFSEGVWNGEGDLTLNNAERVKGTFEKGLLVNGLGIYKLNNGKFI